MKADQFLADLRDTMLFTQDAADDLLGCLGMNTSKDNPYYTPELRLQAMQVVATVKLYESIEELLRERE